MSDNQIFESEEVKIEKPNKKSKKSMTEDRKQALKSTRKRKGKSIRE